MKSVRHPRFILHILYLHLHVKNKPRMTNKYAFEYKFILVGRILTYKYEFVLLGRISRFKKCIHEFFNCQALCPFCVCVSKRWKMDKEWQ